MKKLNKKQQKILVLISLPILVFVQYFLFKVGLLSPMLRGIDLKIVNGDYVADLDEYTVKLNETVKLSSGSYIIIPSYAKKPNIKFAILDNENILKIKGNELTGIKEGISTVGIIKNKRVLRKANIRVIDPKVEDIIVSTENNLNYVGETTKIDTVVKVDYDKFKEKEKATYKSSNEGVVKIEGNKLKAIGVGNANIYIKSKNKEEILSYNIQAKVDKISINNVIKLDNNDSIKLKPTILTSPRGLKHPNIKYELIESKLPIQRAIRLDSDGTIVGLKEGEEKVKISCGNKSKIITIKVVNEPILDKLIKNLKYSYEIIEHNTKVKLTWDKVDDIYYYDIYMKNNSLNETNFKKYKTVELEKGNISLDKVYTDIKLSLIDFDLSIYITGEDSKKNVYKSNIINIKDNSFEDNDVKEEKLEVNNLVSYIDVENNLVKLTWDKTLVDGVEYSIYIKNNLEQDKGFELLNSNIETNEYTMDIPNQEIDIDVYVKANKEQNYSDNSNIVNIKRELQNESNEVIE